MTRRYTQHELKTMLITGMALPVNKDNIDYLIHGNIDKIGVSIGLYGINGVLVQDNKTGEFYAVACRNSYTAMLA